MDLQNLHSAFDIRQRHINLPVESTRSSQCRIQHVDPIGCSTDDYLFIRFKTVHLDEDGIERLLALIVSTTGETRTAATAHRIDFIEEDDARAVVFGLFEKIANSTGTHADKHLDEVRTGDGEERNIRLPRDGLGKQCFTGAGFTHQQHAAWDSATEPLKLFRILQKLDDLHHFVFGLFDARHIIESDVRVFLAGDAVLAAAKVTEHPTGTGTVAKLAEDKEPDETEQHQPGNQRHDQGGEKAAAVLNLNAGFVDEAGVGIKHPLHHIEWLRSRENFSAEHLHFADAGKADRVAKLAANGVALQRDDFHVGIFKLLLEFADVNIDAAAAFVVEKDKQHHRDGDEENPSKKSTAKFKASAIRAGTRRGGTAIFAGGTIGSLFCHRNGS